MNVQELVEQAEGRLVILDAERRVVASNIGLELGARVDGALDAVVLYADGYDDLRSGFTAAVSHELRTPLARLLVLLESASLPGAEVEELLERARGEVEEASALIDDILFLGELETGREVVSLGSTVVRPVVEEVVAEHALRAAAADVTVIVRVGGGDELPLRPRMLRVVVENLLSNAIRYAGAGARCTIETSGTVLIVSDDGAGVRTSELPRLFERFYRADEARSTRGTGLGLAIVKHVVGSAGGAVEATGAPGRGLTVTCRFGQ